MTGVVADVDGVEDGAEWPAALCPPPHDPTANSTTPGGDSVCLHGFPRAWPIRSERRNDGLSRAPLRFAREVGDQLVLMDAGVVVETGKPREVLANPQQERTKAFLSKVL